MALTHLLCIYLNAELFIEEVKAPHFFMHLVCNIHLRYVHYINSEYDLCLGVIQLQQKPGLLCFHHISTCTQFVRTDSCLLLWGRLSENIEPAHSTKRQQHQHNSDSSEKVLDEQSPPSTFYFSFWP